MLPYIKTPEMRGLNIWILIGAMTWLLGILIVSSLPLGNVDVYLVECFLGRREAPTCPNHTISGSLVPRNNTPGNSVSGSQ